MVSNIRQSTTDVDLRFLSIRAGTKLGVVSHFLRLENPADVDYWSENFNQSIQSAVFNVREIAFR